MSLIDGGGALTRQYQEWNLTNTPGGTFTFVVPAGVSTLFVDAAGGGGGGGGGNPTPGGGGGGGGSSVMCHMLPIEVMPGDVMAGVIGAGGAGGPANTVGNAGTLTTLARNGLVALRMYPGNGGLPGLSPNGGNGAGNALVTTSTGGGGTGANGGSLMVTINSTLALSIGARQGSSGGAGGALNFNGGTAAFCGAGSHVAPNNQGTGGAAGGGGGGGGASIFGFGTQGGFGGVGGSNGAAGAAPVDPYGYGAGGGGGSGNAAGGAGNNGFIRIFW